MLLLTLCLALLALACLVAGHAIARIADAHRRRDAASAHAIGASVAADVRARYPHGGL